jgi:hypothetical protein
MVSSASQLEEAINDAEGTKNSDPRNVISLAPGTYQLTNEVIQNQNTAAPNKTLTIIGQGAGADIQSDGKGRVFDVKGANVTFQNLVIEGGKVTSSKPDNIAQGGGLLIEGGQVILSGVTVQGNTVQGATGNAGVAGAPSPTSRNGGKGATPRAAASTWLQAL